MHLLGDPSQNVALEGDVEAAVADWLQRFSRATQMRDRLTRSVLAEKTQNILIGIERRARSRVAEVHTCRSHFAQHRERKVDVLMQRANEPAFEDGVEEVAVRDGVNAVGRETRAQAEVV